MSNVDTGVAQNRTELLESVASMNASRGNQTTALSRRVSDSLAALVTTPQDEVASLTNHLSDTWLKCAHIRDLTWAGMSGMQYHPATLRHAGQVVEMSFSAAPQA